MWTSNLGTCLMGLAMGLSIVGGMITPALAQSFRPSGPVGAGTSGNREAGATRGSCIRSDQRGYKNLIALRPANDLVQTATAYPSVHAYFPASNAQFAQFALYEDGSDELVYGSLFNITGRPGLVAIDVPDTATVEPLRMGQRYSWQLTLICEVGQPDSYISIDGRFERVSGDGVNQRLQGVPITQQPSIYAEAGLWPEALNSVVKASQVNRTTAEQSLENLLRSVGLDSFITDLAGEPLFP